MIRRRRRWSRRSRQSMQEIQKRKMEKWIVEIPEETARRIGLSDVVLPLEDAIKYVNYALGKKIR
jgi:hypothetical protein